MSEQALFNAIGVLILLALIGLLWVWLRFDERPKKGRRRDD